VSIQHTLRFQIQWQLVFVSIITVDDKVNAAQIAVNDNAALIVRSSGCRLTAWEYWDCSRRTGAKKNAGVHATLFCLPLPHRYAEAVLSESGVQAIREG
jgi:hypothetical protein